jgi:predicted  nucleic acid-binding Zn-ribbon protein
MSRQVYALLWTILLVASVAMAASLKIYERQTQESQTIAALRAQVSDLKQDLHDTELALDKTALEGARLGEENEALRARIETAERKHIYD